MRNVKQRTIVRDKLLPSSWEGRLFPDLSGNKVGNWQLPLSLSLSLSASRRRGKNGFLGAEKGGYLHVRGGYRGDMTWRRARARGRKMEQIDSPKANTRYALLSRAETFVKVLDGLT